jgi:hypothetical protein
MVLIRREDPASRHSKNEPMIGPSYGTQAPDKMPLKEYERRATRFVALMLLAQAVLIALVYTKETLIKMAGVDLPAGMAADRLVLLAIGIYGWMVLAYAMAKTGESVGLGFWLNFTMGLIPPLLPAVAARIGSRSIMWTYLYLSLDLLVMTLAVRFFEAAPLLCLLVIAAEIPLLIYHVLGCAVGSIASALGMNAYVATIWACGVPLVLLVYVAYDQGALATIVTGLVDQSGGASISLLTALLDPSVIAGSFTLMGLVAIWGVMGWLFWLKSVYESLRYPLM